MPNPTWDQFLSANASYVWADGDVYLIPQTDTAEGAGPGASFNGLGVNNQPHQILLNKINYLKQQVKQYSSQATANGSYRLSIGGISPIIQWGAIVQSGPVTLLSAPGNTGGLSPVLLTARFPTPFTTAIWQLVVSFSLSNNFSPQASSQFKAPFNPNVDPFGDANSTQFQVVWPPSLTQFQVALVGEDWDTYFGTFWWSTAGY